MKISAFESSFLNEEEAKWASAIGGGMLLFLFYCGWVSEKISFRKTCKASEMACNASERVYKVTGKACMHHIVLFAGRTVWNQFLKVKKGSY